MSAEHEVSEYAAICGIPTIHEAEGLESAEDVGIRRLRHDLALVRDNLEQAASDHPDGTRMADPDSFEAKWAKQYGCGHPKDPGHQISRLQFVTRKYGLAHPEVAAVLDKLAGWEARLPVEFECVRAEYLAWHAAEIAAGSKMFRDWEGVQ